MGSLQRSLLQSNIPPEQESKYFSASEGSASFMSTNSSNKSQVSDQSHHFHHQIPNYGVMNSSPSTLNNPSSNFMSKDGGGSYDLCGEFDQALYMYFGGQSPSSSLPEQKMNCGMRPPTLNIFPSQPMHVDPSPSNKVSAMDLVNSANGGSKRPTEPSEAKTTAAIPPPSAGNHPQPKAVKHEGNAGKGGMGMDHDRPKTPDAKTQRRLAQNREAARKSRLRKKAYIQQLESSRVKLTQLEQEIQRSARAQGFGNGGGSVVGEQGLALGMSNLSSVVFDVEYARWLDEHNRLMYELRGAIQEHSSENELRLYVDNCLSHFNEIMNLKTLIARTDVFHLVSGNWKTPAERCFMWIGGFRPSDLIKMIPSQIDPLPEQQLMAICELQRSTAEAEEALSQGLNQLNQSISSVIVSDSLTCPGNMTNYMGQMGVAMAKLSTLESFVRQADTVRHQTVHQLNQLLTTHQAAKSIIAVAEFFHRLRTLSSLWVARPRQD